jgi:hypothetical protein
MNDTHNTTRDAKHEQSGRSEDTYERHEQQNDGI